MCDLSADHESQQPRTATALSHHLALRACPRTRPQLTGGGPTGVEFAAELHDLLHTEVKKHFPGLHRFARISLYDVAPRILGSFDEGLQQ